MKSFDYKALGKRIFIRRKELGLTQEEIAEKLNISRVYFSSIESGKRRIYTSTLVAIANALETTADELLLGQQEWDQKACNHALGNILLDCSPENRKIIIQATVALKKALTKTENDSQY